MNFLFAGACCAAIFFALTLRAPATEPIADNLSAQIPTPGTDRQKLLVGVAEGPPFNIHEPDGSWSGISVELWKRIASILHVAYEFRETDLEGNFTGLASGLLDIAVGPLTITEHREELCDFTHIYFSSTLGVAVAMPKSQLPSDLRFLGALFDRKLWFTIIRISVGLAAVMAMVALLIWICERRANATNFGGGGRPIRGIGAALWWSAVTMTAVGYGDVAPKTLTGRFVAVLWMFVSLVLVSTFTATMASILTAARINEGTSIHDLNDLRGVRVGTFSGSTAALYLRQNNIPYTTSKRGELFAALATGKIQAVVYDEPFLRYIVRKEYPGRFSVLPLRLDPQLYAFGIRDGSPLREPINRAMLLIIHEPDWSEVLYSYMGNSSE